MGEIARAATAGAGDSADSVDVLIAEVRSGKRLRPGRTLRGAMLIDRDLSGLNLAGADLSRANLTRANLVGANLEGAVLFGATLDHAELLKGNLRGADLTQASARGAGFGGANLEDANLFNATLTGATFTQSNLRGVDARTADMTGARLRECCLHDADCSQSALCETDLGESDVRGATFDGADLRRSRLSGLRGATEANWIGADILDVDFCGAYLVRRHILDQNYLHEFRRQSRTTQAVYWVWWATSDCGPELCALGSVDRHAGRHLRPVVPICGTRPRWSAGQLDDDDLLQLRDAHHPRIRRHRPDVRDGPSRRADRGDYRIHDAGWSARDLRQQDGQAGGVRIRMLKFFARKDADPQTQLKEVFEGYALPTFPAIYLEALQQVRDRTSSAAALADVLALDPGLTMRLLGTVNSAAFGLRSPVTSVHHAVSMLGRGHIESMLISLAAHSVLPAEPRGGFEPNRFWRAAARRAATARALADRVNPAECSECFTAGLLSDMAVPVLSDRKGPAYARILERWHEAEGELHEMEQAAFGWDHAQVASLMCREWGFPDVIAEAIASHHDSHDGDFHALAPVSLAALIPEVDGEGAIATVAERAHNAIGMDADEVRSLVENSFLQAEEIAGQFVS